MHVIITNTVVIQAKRCNDGHHESFCTEQTRWGDIIWSTSNTSDGLILTKSLSLLAGAALFAAAILLTLTLTLTKRQAAPVPILHRYVSASAAM